MVGCLLWASISVAERATPTVSPTATPSPVPQAKCCACIVPDAGETDHERFTEECQACYLNENENPKAHGCSQKIIAERSQFDQALTDLKRQGQCLQRVYIANNQHGPSFSDLVGNIRACVKTFPTCSLDVDDLSCQSFRDEQSLGEFVESMRSELYPNVTLTMCGNTSSNFGSTCARLAASKSYVVTRGVVDTPKLPCNSEGTICHPAGHEWSCLDTNGQIIKQTCCQAGQGFGLSDTFGVWINRDSCKDVRRCDSCQSTEVSCVSSQMAVATRCITLQAGGQVCGDLRVRCKTGTKCVDGWCLAMATPTPSATTEDSRSVAAANQKSASRRGALAAVPGVAQHFKASGSTLALAFTQSLFFGSSGVTPVSGVNGTTGVAITSLDPVSTIGMVGLRNGDIIHFVNDQQVSSEADILSALAQSRKRTFITYSRLAPKEPEGRTSKLQVGPRWNWIITIHEDDSVGRAPEQK